ncbi:hypothetical protein EXIGLDRAFT_246769 [Exidia glandulosa HHB12029]|uniref:Uncharacterized protein n=1 Tax=Exidia glandulosa HHB12029 TaxID=1314781 RepID=A0A165QAN2_EXIGL|nr:hypothetical protein EXIGLDRAFT_246769 [Exidia glandulosa HHB12029]
MQQEALDPKTTLCEGRLVFDEGKRALAFLLLPFVTLCEILSEGDIENKAGRYLAMFATRLFGSSGSPQHLSWTVQVIDENVAFTTTTWTEHWRKPVEWTFVKRYVYSFMTSDPTYEATNWLSSPSVSMEEPNWQSDGWKNQQQYASLFSGDNAWKPSSQKKLIAEIRSRDNSQCVLTERNSALRAVHFIPPACGSKFIVAAFAQAFEMTTATQNTSWTPVQSPWQHPELFGECSIYNAVLLLCTFKPDNQYGMPRHALLATPNMWLEGSDVKVHLRNHEPRREEDRVREWRFTLHLLQDLVFKTGDKDHDVFYSTATCPPEHLGVKPEYLLTGMDALVTNSSGRIRERSPPLATPVSDEILETVPSDRRDRALLPPAELVNTAYCGMMMYWFRTGEVDCIIRSVCRRLKADEDGAAGGRAEDRDLGSDDSPDVDRHPYDSSEDEDEDEEEEEWEDEEEEWDPECPDYRGDLAEYRAIFAILCQLPLPPKVKKVKRRKPKYLQAFTWTEMLASGMLDNPHNSTLL